MNEHRAALMPFSVFDADGERIGYACTCSCGGGFYQAGSGAKDRCWELLAGHMVMANPELAALASRARRGTEGES